LAQEVLSSLIFEIAANTASLSKGLSDAKNKISTFSKGVQQIGGYLKAAFAATAIIGAAKEVFNFSQEIGNATSAVNGLTDLFGKDLINVTAGIKATADTFGQDFNEVLKTTNALARQMGVSFEEASHLIQKGVSLNDDNAAEFLGLLKQYPAQFATMGVSASEFIAIASQTMDSGVMSDQGIAAIAKAGNQLRQMNKPASDALKAIGISSEALQASIADGSMTTFQAIQMISNKLKGFKDDSQQVGDVIMNVFGKAGVQAGAEYIKSLGEMDLSLDNVVANTDAAAKANLHLVEASTDLNKVWVSLFGNSSTYWTELKADLIDIAVNAFQKIKKVTVDVINYFIELYNESLMFRLTIQEVILVFKELWSIVKYVFNQIIDGFSSTGKIIGAILKGEFSKIPDLVIEAFQKINNNSIQLGKETGQNFKDAINGVLRKSPIQLITDSEVQQQVSKATSAAKGSASPLGNFHMEMPREEAPTIFKESDLYTENMGVKVDGLIQQTQSLTTVWSDFGASFNDIMGNQAPAAVDALSNAFSSMFTDQKAGFKDLVTVILGGIKQVLAALLAKAIAGMIAGEASKGIVGLALAAVGVGALMSFWQAKVPKFETGGLVQGSGFQMVGEKGAELVSMPTGSRVFSHAQTRNIFSGMGSGINGLTLQAVVTGEQLRFVLAETNRRRN
jgi:hypothetical protein